MTKRVVDKNDFLTLSDPHSGIEVWISPMGFMHNLTLALVDRSTDTVAIVDPYNGKRWLKRLADEKLRPTHIALTHTHCDHVWGLPVIQKAYPDIEIHVHRDALYPLNTLKSKFIFRDVAPTHQWAMPPHSQTDWQCGNMCWILTHSPGHAPGHITLEGHGFFLSGDLLFTQLSGRCDIPGADPIAQVASLRNARDRMREMPQDQRFIPGHNYKWIDGTRPAWVTVGEVLEHNRTLQKLD